MACCWSQVVCPDDVSTVLGLHGELWFWVQTTSALAFTFAWFCSYEWLHAECGEVSEGIM